MISLSSVKFRMSFVYITLVERKRCVSIAEHEKACLVLLDMDVSCTSSVKSCINIEIFVIL